MNTPLVRAPRYKNFAESFFNGLSAVGQAMLDSSLLHHYSAGPSWSNIRIPSLLWVLRALFLLSPQFESQQPLSNSLPSPPSSSLPFPHTSLPPLSLFMGYRHKFSYLTIPYRQIIFYLKVRYRQITTSKQVCTFMLTFFSSLQMFGGWPINYILCFLCVKFQHQPTKTV
jgi:hypothetical protein